MSFGLPENLEEQLRENGFSVVEETVIEDLSSVKKEKDLIPPTKDVHFRIKSVSTDTFKEGAYRNIKLQLQIIDGIQVGEVNKFKNKVMFQSVTYYADPKVYTAEYFQKRQHLVQLKFLLNAIGEDLSKVKINDEFLNSLVGKEILGNIKQSKKKDWTNKNGELVVGEMQNEVVDFKKYEMI